MQPTRTVRARRQLEEQVRTLTDWLYAAFKPTDAVQVRNILSKPYKFSYCVGEEIETPDKDLRKVVSRDFDDYVLAPGEVRTLIGGAAYIAVDGITQDYVFAKYGADGANAKGDIQKLIAAAKLVLVESASFEDTMDAKRKVTSRGGSRAEVEQDDQGESVEDVSDVVNPAANEEQAFSQLEDKPSGVTFTLGETVYDTLMNKGKIVQYRKANKMISKTEFEEAQAAAENLGNYKLTAK